MKTLTFTTHVAWRSWLRKNHATHTEAWLVLHKKHTQKKGLTYEEAVEEALCFGWVDGQLRRIDDKKHMLRFSPRRRNSSWAPSNIRRVRKLIKEKRMTGAGLQVFKAAKLETQAVPTIKTVMKKSKRIILPVDLHQALAARPVALKHFLGYPPSFRLLAVQWVTSAKKAETRRRRIGRVVDNALKHVRPTF